MKKKTGIDIEESILTGLQVEADKRKISRNALINHILEGFVTTGSSEQLQNMKVQLAEATLNLILAKISKTKEQTRVYSAQADILENTGKNFSKKELQVAVANNLETKPLNEIQKIGNTNLNPNFNTRKEGSIYVLSCKMCDHEDNSVVYESALDMMTNHLWYGHKQGRFKETLEK